VTRWDNESLYADWIPLHTQWRRRNCQVRARFSLVDDTPIAEAESREMENISRGPTFGDFVTVRTEASMQDITVARLQSKEYRLPFPPILNVMYCVRDSLWTVKIFLACATLKRRGSWIISVYLWSNRKKKHGVWDPMPELSITSPYSGRTKYSAFVSKLNKLSEEYLSPQETQKAAVFFIGKILGSRLI